MKQSPHNDHNLEVELLQKIRIQEEVIEKSIQEARAQGARRVDEARKKAKESIENALKGLQEEARKYKEQRRKALANQTETLLSQAKKEHEKILKQAQQNLNAALQTVFSYLLPKSLTKSSKEKMDILSEASS